MYVQLTGEEYWVRDKRGKLLTSQARDHIYIMPTRNCVTTYQCIIHIILYPRSNQCLHNNLIILYTQHRAAWTLLRRAVKNGFQLKRPRKK